MNKIRIGIISPSEIAFRRFLPALKSAEGFEYIGVATASKEEYSGATDEILDRHRKKALPFMENFGGKIFDGYETMILSPELMPFTFLCRRHFISNGLKRLCST